MIGGTTSDYAASSGAASVPIVRRAVIPSSPQVRVHCNTHVPQWNDESIDELTSKDQTQREKGDRR